VVAQVLASPLMAGGCCHASKPTACTGQRAVLLVLLLVRASGQLLLAQHMSLLHLLPEHRAEGTHNAFWSQSCRQVGFKLADLHATIEVLLPTDTSQQGTNRSQTYIMAAVRQHCHPTLLFSCSSCAPAFVSAFLTAALLQSNTPKSIWGVPAASCPAQDIRQHRAIAALTSRVETAGVHPVW
jgi:hypothetical protein